MYALLNWVIIGSGNDLSPDRRHAIARTNSDVLPIWCSEIFAGEIEIKSNKPIPEYGKQPIKKSKLGWGPQCITVLCTE